MKRIIKEEVDLAFDYYKSDSIGNDLVVDESNLIKLKIKLHDVYTNYLIELIDGEIESYNKQRAYRHVPEEVILLAKHLKSKLLEDK